MPQTSKRLSGYIGLGLSFYCNPCLGTLGGRILKLFVQDIFEKRADFFSTILVVVRYDPFFLFLMQGQTRIEYKLL